MKVETGGGWEDFVEKFIQAGGDLVGTEFISRGGTIRKVLSIDKRIRSISYMKYAAGEVDNRLNGYLFAMLPPSSRNRFVLYKTLKGLRLRIHNLPRLD